MTTTQLRTAEAPSVPQPRRPHRAAAAVVGAPLLLAAVVAVVLLAFGLPAVKGAPHDLPIGVAGAPAATTQVVEGLTQREPGALAVTAYDSQDALVAAIRDRDVYGGIVVGPSGLTVLTASAASPAVAQALTTMGQQLASAQHATAAVRDVVPLPAADPRGIGVAMVVLPLVIGSVLPALALGRLTVRRRDQVAGALVYSVVGGLATAGVLHHWFGSIDGDYLAESGVMAATLAAGTLALVGLHRVFGRAGLAVGAVTLVLVANPLSGAMSAPELLGSPWREIGQGMTPGAGAQLLRSVAFFDGAGTTAAWWVLAAWAVTGLVLLALPARRRDPAAST
jgi:hypothetical protein